ncbi:MAG: hypothetical protein IJ761_00145 [Bacteroidales bacterium]|nr:hypothetical protein [Bacteroidales bacterium]
MLRSCLNRSSNVKSCLYSADDVIVQNNLAVTPSDMANMVAQGIPVSPTNLGMTYDEGYSNVDFDIPLDRKRGVDMAMLYEAQQAIKSKLRKNKDAIIKSLDNDPD